MRVRSRPPLSLADPEPVSVKRPEADAGDVGPETSPSEPVETDAEPVVAAHEPASEFGPEPEAVAPEVVDANPTVAPAVEAEPVHHQMSYRLRSASAAPLQFSPIPPVAAPEPEISSAAEQAPDMELEQAVEEILEPAPVPADPQTPATAAPRRRSAADKDRSRKGKSKADRANGGVLGTLLNPYFAAGIAAALWAGGVCAYAFGYQQGWGAFNYEPFRFAVLALLALAPIPLLFGAALLMRRSSALALETRRAYALSQAMTAPAVHAATETVDLVRMLREEIAQATAAAERARAELTAMRAAMNEQTSELNQACTRAVTSAGSAADQLGVERERMLEVGETLDRQAATVSASMDNQFHMVRDAAELAQAQLREAESALAARAADLAAAAGEAQDAARLASDDLARQTLRLETAGAGVAEQIRSVEEGLSQQRASMVQEAYQLRADQEAFSALVESQRAQMVEVLSTARTASSELGDVSSRSAAALNDMVQAAAQHFRELAAASDGERGAFESAVRERFEQFVALAAAARDEIVETSQRGLMAMRTSAEEMRRAADDAAEAARLRVDGLGEAAFEAGRRADQAFDARMATARRLVEESASVVEAAGARTAEKIETDVKAMAAAIAEIEDALSQIDGRAARLPEEAKARIDEIRAAVADGLNALSAATRKVAEETEAADAAFHDRVKRNYDMLTEAVRLMGVVSGEGPSPIRRAEPPEGHAQVPHASQPVAESGAEPNPDEPLTFSLRGRIRPPRQEPEGVRSLFETPSPRPEAEGWSWRDVLGGLDPDARAAAADDEAAATRLIEEIRRLGVDPQALLPRSRVEEAAGAWQRRDPDAARQVVRRVAPAAVRRISRRVITDRTLRALAERYVSAFQARLAAEQGGEPALIALLGSEGGRSFLLIDAAVGDLG